MTHQITLLGGQILPVYIGVLERNPDTVHILYTKESVRLKNRLEKNLSSYKSISYQVDPYNYKSIEETVTNIICDNEGATFELNLTSGTKLMALASQEVFKTMECFSFYIDQNQNLIDISNGTQTKLQKNISTKNFLLLSNHNTFSSTSLEAFSNEDLKLANLILELRKSKSGISELFKLLRAIDVKSECTSFTFNNKKFSINWNGIHLKVSAPKFNIESKGANAFKILSSGLWWELIVASAISSWKWAREVHMSLAIKSNTNSKLDKNEIDILINTGRKILFIECKSGKVTQSDINKMRAIGKFYGGISSKSILVSYYKPQAHLIEKCQDFGIEVFYLEEFNKKHVKLNSISKKLDFMLSKIEI